MKKQVILQEKIEVQGLSHDGRGIAVHENKKIFIAGALPNEIVTVSITRKRKQYSESEVEKIITPSPLRVSPPCKHFGICGGCSLQHMDMQTQLHLKEKTLLEQLKHFGKVTPKTLLPPLSANTLGYRRKARLGVKFVFKKNKVLVGFREKESRYLSDIDRCVILHPKVGEKINQLVELISTLSAYQHIPQIEVAVGDTQTALLFRHLIPFSADDQEKLKQFAITHDVDIYTQPNPPASLQKLWPMDAKHHITYTLPDFHLEFLLHPLDFMQINLEMNRLMVALALQHLDVKSDEKVLDLFCGIGNFTLPIAKSGESAVGIENSAEMVARAQNNAVHNRVKNIEFFAANLQEPQTNAAWMKTKYDKILLDPPRAGAKEIIPFFNQFKAKRIVYVSCNPATLARDAQELVHTNGYQLTHAGIMNMFPHTAHIEAIAVFAKA